MRVAYIACDYQTVAGDVRTSATRRRHKSPWRVSARHTMNENRSGRRRIVTSPEPAIVRGFYRWPRDGRRSLTRIKSGLTTDWRSAKPSPTDAQIRRQGAPASSSRSHLHCYYGYFRVKTAHVADMTIVWRHGDDYRSPAVTVWGWVCYWSFAMASSGA